MTAKLTVALEFANDALAKELKALLSRMPEVSLVAWQNGAGEKGALTSKSLPEIIMLDDAPVYGTLAERVARLRGSFPHATVFVVSETQQPEQIVAVMKAGAAEFFVSPVKPAILEKAIDEVRAQLARSGQLAKGKVYSFMSAKGGLGSTVLSVNIATALALRKKQSVALCDLSRQSGDSTVLLDIVPKTNMADIASNFHRLDTALLKDCMTRHGSGLEVLAAPFRLERSEEIRPEHIARMMELLKQLYDIILVDCASIFVDDCEVESFRHAEKIFLVTDLSVPAIRNASRLARLLGELGMREGQIEFVLNRFHKNSSLPLEEAEETLRKRIFWLFPNDFQDVVKSINRGIPIVQLLPQSALTENINAFAERLLNPHANPDYRGVRGMFGKAL